MKFIYWSEFLNENCETTIYKSTGRIDKILKIDFYLKLNIVRTIV